MEWSSNTSLEEGLNGLNYGAATEVTGTELDDIIGGRKEIFNTFYERVVKGMKARGKMMMDAVASYEDRNVENLSTPYLFNYTLFTAEDKAVLWRVTGIKEEEVNGVIEELRRAIKDGCKLKGYTTPASLFVNVTADRVIMFLMLRYYLERGDKRSMERICAYAGYSMYYTLFTNFWPRPPRRETMVYTVNSLTKKHKLRNVESVGALLGYGVEVCTTTYKQKMMNCTDNDVIYVIGQWKSRIRGYIKGIANQYYENDKAKEAIFTSVEKIENEEGVDYVERSSKAGNIEQLAQQYSTRFFQKPIDDEIVQVCSKMNEVSRLEIKNALEALRADKARIPEVKAFYEALFYLFSEELGTATFDVHSKKFLASMDTVYKRGNSKDKNITTVKNMLENWLSATSQTYREATRNAKINSYRKAIYQYFVFGVALRS